MANIKRTANAQWQGGLQDGSGTLTAPSGVLKDTAYSFKTRFGDQPGTNPEELIVAAHAGCFTMALSNVLGSAGHPPTSLTTDATLEMDASGGGFKIGSVVLKVQGTVDGIDQAQFQQYAQQAEQGCPVSGALRGNVQISVEASLNS